MGAAQGDLAGGEIVEQGAGALYLYKVALLPCCHAKLNPDTAAVKAFSHPKRANAISILKCKTVLLAAHFQCRIVINGLQYQLSFK